MATPRNNDRGPVYGGSWSPWYSSYGSGLNWYYGYSSYNPYLFTSSRWIWGRYGMWYDPFNPFGYNPYGGAGYYAPAYSGGYGDGDGGYASSGGSRLQDETGSVRVRVKPSHGKVYLDGTLMGSVDDFDGLTSHLATTAGAHELEVRADGYQTLKTTVDVEGDRTITIRGSLKKN